MGCITGIISKTFLIAFNVVVAIAGLAVLSLASIVQTRLNGYGKEIPDDPQNILIGLQTVSACIICLGALGVVVSCCCGNKLFLYTYFILGLILVIVTIVFASMGAANINNDTYTKDIKAKMQTDNDNYNCRTPSTDDNKTDQIYKENKCCGYTGVNELPASCSSTVPAGCCKVYTGLPCSKSSDIYTTGCYEQLTNDVGDLATPMINFSIFFGILLFALLASTCLCVKCTDAMPI